ALFKLIAPAKSEILGGSLAQVADGARWIALLKNFAVEIARFGETPLHPIAVAIVCAALLGFGRERMRVEWTALALIFAGYCGVYLITPFSIDWQMSTSANRLLLQLWPAALFTFFGMVRVEQPAATAKAEPKKPPRRRR
ncbi:MAG: hypothetical protein ACRD96_20235, partial [Bryobacteraceae bacterium]